MTWIFCFPIPRFTTYQSFARELELLNPGTMQYMIGSVRKYGSRSIEKSTIYWRIQEHSMLIGKQEKFTVTTIIIEPYSE